MFSINLKKCIIVRILSISLALHVCVCVYKNAINLKRDDDDDMK